MKKQVTTYYSDGKVFFEYTEDEQELKQGEYIKYFNDPHVPEESCNYKDGLLHGEILQYKLVNKKPILVLKGNYKYDKLDGIYQTWFEGTGKPLTIINYKGGKKHGEYLEFYKNGNLCKKYKYTYDKLISVSKAWFNTGEIELEFVDKTCITYNKDGKILEKKIVDNDFDIIYSTIYNIEGKVKEINEFKNGKIIKQIIPDFDDYFEGGCYNLKNVSKITDYENKTKTLLYYKDEPNKRIIYDLNSNKISSDYIDKQGNVIPTLFTKIKEFLCPSKRDINKYKKDYIEEEMQLMSNTHRKRFT